MHNALAVLLSVFFIASSTTARVVSPPPSSSALDDKCTFTLWHKQLYPSSDSAPTSRNYIQINTLFDHANDITIDIAHLRPSTAFHSYSKVSETQVFAIEGLLDGTNVTVRGTDGRDALRLESDGLVWMADGVARGDDAWCEVGEWNANGKDGKINTRCAFPCDKIESDEEERYELR
ncbi:hypothetical protein BKA66DRAFT_424823 [Pyrenochaeta sp. MPI-SDFR-AT-0127]|nr:hypothetical protein BKA66DRAFT_424823 [Pyrenochaeta sp. MPI-SDFR-AT-0127]